MRHFIPILSLLVLASACSDTRCRDKLDPAGGVTTSDLCTAPGMPPDDAGNNDDTPDAALDDANNPNQPDVPTDDTGADTPTQDTSTDDTSTEPDLPPDTTPDTTPPVDPEDALQGDWLSQGADIAPLLQRGDFAFTAVTASFDTNGDYTGLLTFETGDEVPYGGSYRLDTSTTPWGIVLTQTAPSALTSQGIVQVDGDGVMRLEVVQVDPPTPGFQPPTPAGGFGSTVGVSDDDDNIQTYRRP